MNLAIFLALGDSFENMAKAGQDSRFKKFYLSFFAKEFERVYVFSYQDEEVDGIPNNVIVIRNKYQLHRYLYGILIPFIHYKIIKECSKIRVYHLHGTIPAIVIKILLGKNYSFNYAYDYLKDALISKSYFQYLFYKLLYYFALITASKIFVANKLMLSKINSNRSIYLPNGVDTKFFSPRDKKNKNIKPLVLSVGRLERVKNYTNLIKAIAQIDANLMIIGSGSLKNELINEANKYKVDLKLLEKVDNTEMPGIYNKADVFVLPSLQEGHPKVLLEAMACGIPCIGTNVTGINDIIKDRQNGLLCTIEFDNIAKSIKELLKNKKLSRQISANGREDILLNYNLDSLLKLEVEEIMK